MSLHIRFKLQKKYVAFLTVVPLLSITALVQVGDPVCGGTGVLSNAPGMDRVEIVSSVSREVARDPNVCGLFFLYLYDVELTVVNKGPDDTQGPVELILTDLLASKVVDRHIVALVIPGETTLEVSYSVWFKSTQELLLLRTETHARVVTEDIPCPICNGTGKIPLNTWLVTNTVKNAVKELVRGPMPPSIDFLEGGD